MIHRHFKISLSPCVSVATDGTAIICDDGRVRGSSGLGNPITIHSHFWTPITILRATTLLICLLTSPTSGHAQDAYAAQRQRMVDEFIATEGVTNPRVLEAMRTVPRHVFVRPQLRPLAYFDQALDIGYKQTISPPFIVAYMTEVLDPQPDDVVLEIGTGSGYQAAVLSGLVKEVYTIEIVEPLGKRAAALLDRLDYKNVHVKIGDGYQGWPEHAPFDKIIVTCSPEDVPQPLIEQLKEGGKMIIPLGERYQQVFHLLEKQDGELKETKLLPTLFVPMTGQMEELRQKQPDGANPQLVNGSFELDEDQNGQADGWHYQRRCRIDENAPAGEKCICFENSEPGRTSHLLQGAAIDGSQVRQLRIRWIMKSADIRPGRRPTDVPGIIVYFFDGKRLPVHRVAVGGSLADDPNWTKSQAVIDVPATAKEMILQAGLNGAMGTFYLNDIAIEAVH